MRQNLTVGSAHRQLLRQIELCRQFCLGLGSPPGLKNLLIHIGLKKVMKLKFWNIIFNKINYSF